MIKHILNSYNVNDNNNLEHTNESDEVIEEIKIQPPVPNDNIVNKI